MYKNICNSLSPLIRIIREKFLPYKLHLFLGFFSISVVITCNYLFIKLFPSIINEIYYRSSKPFIIKMILVLSILLLIKSSFEYFQNFFIKSISYKALCSLQKDLHTKILSSNINTLYTKGDILSRLSNDIMLIRNLIYSFIFGFIKHFVNVLSSVLGMIYLDMVLLFLVIAILFIILYVVSFISKNLRNNVLQIQSKLAYYNNKIGNLLDSLKIIKIFRSSNYEIKKANDLILNISSFYKKNVKLDSLTVFMFEISINTLIITMLVYCISFNKLVNNPGYMVSFFIAITRVFQGIKGLIMLNPYLQEGLVAAKRFFSIIDKKDYTSFVNKSKILLQENEYDIVFDEVSFIYDNNKHILDKCSFTVPKSKITAIVGSPGSGKTSVFNLISKFIFPTSGNIFLRGEKNNNFNIKDIDSNVLLSNLIFVTQEILLFDGTIAENISYPHFSNDSKLIERACDIADAKSFIEELPFSYRTKINYKGEPLSQGQKQKISLARAIFNSPKIILLDETTSSMDQKSESIIFSSMKKMLNDKTIFVITHRTSNLSYFDKVLYIRDKKVVE